MGSGARQCPLSPKRKMEKIVIALVDCNAFFCSCERLFRPDLWRRPVGVLSNNDGCFVSRTKELKALGVKMGQPFFEVKELCQKNQVAVFSANFALYTNISDRVMNVLKTMAPLIEVYSVDEAFLDWSGMSHQNLEQMAREVRLRVWKEVGIPVSVGVAPTKVLAKLSNQLAKKQNNLKGVLVLDNQMKTMKAMQQTSIGDLWGVGARSAQKFQLMNIHTAYDLYANENERKIQKVFTKVGRKIQDELRGISCFPLKLYGERKQQIHCSRSFGELIYKQSQLEEALANFISKAMVKLRAQQSLVQGLSIYFSTSPFRQGFQHEVYENLSLSFATQDTRKIIALAIAVVRQRFQYGMGYYKAGIGLHHLIHQEFEQLDLFVDGDDEQNRTLMKVMDHINAIEGADTLKSMACRLQDKMQWKMRQELRSPRYVTGWSELRKII